MQLPSLSLSGFSITQVLSLIVVIVGFLGGSFAVVSYKEKLPDGSSCYFNTICAVPVETINAIRSIPEAKAQGLLSVPIAPAPAGIVVKK